MSRPAPMLVRGAIALSLLPLLGGCMYLTPPTGLCVGGHCGEFEAKRQEAAKQADAAREAQAPQTYDAPDFQLTYPGIWSRQMSRATPESPLVELVDASDPDGLSTTRVGVGGNIALEDGKSTTENMRVITFNRLPQGPEDQIVLALAELGKAQLAGTFDSPPEGTEGESSLGGKKARQVSLVGQAKGGGPIVRIVFRVAIHRNRGYIVILQTLEQRYAASPSAYDEIFEAFKLLEADPTYPVPTPRPTPSGSPSPAASGSPTPAASGSPGAAPAPSGSPTPAPSGSPSASPTPAPAA